MLYIIYILEVQIINLLFVYVYYILIRVSFGEGRGGGHLPPLESYVPPLEFALHTSTLHGAPPKILNRPLCPLLQKLLDETLLIIVMSSVYHFLDRPLLAFSFIVTANNYITLAYIYIYIYTHKFVCLFAYVFVRNGRPCPVWNGSLLWAYRDNF